MQGFWRLGGIALLAVCLVSGCAVLTASTFALVGGSSPESFLRDARIMVNDPRATLASPIETLTIDEARRRYYVVSFDFERDERVFALTLSPSNEGFTTVNNGMTMNRDGTLVAYTSVTAVYAERGRTLLVVQQRMPELEAKGDASVMTRLTSGARAGTTNDPGFHTSLSSLANSVLMERHELSLGDTYRVMGWTKGPATVEMRLLNRDELGQEKPDLARTSFVASASSDGLFTMEGILGSEYPGDDRVRTLDASDYCHLPFVVNGELIALQSLAIKPKDQIGKKPQVSLSSAPGAS